MAREKNVRELFNSTFEAKEHVLLVATRFKRIQVAFEDVVTMATIIFDSGELARENEERLNRMFKFFCISDHDATVNGNVLTYREFDENDIDGRYTIARSFSYEILKRRHLADFGGEQDGMTVLAFENDQQANAFSENLKFALEFCQLQDERDTVKVYGNVVCFKTVEPQLME